MTTLPKMKTNPLAQAGLPVPNPNMRWVANKKKLVIEAVADGKVTKKQVLDYYNISEEEFRSWQVHFSARGKEGLKVTKRLRKR